MKHYLFYILLCGFISIGFSQNTSTIDFFIKNLGITVDGHFNRFSVSTKFNDANSELETISGSITVASIKTGIETRDEHLLNEDYFNAEKHKYITLESTSINKKTENTYAVTAKLSIKGITKEITLNVDVDKTNEGYKIMSTFDLDRRDYKVGGGSFILSKTVKISVIHYHKL